MNGNIVKRAPFGAVAAVAASALLAGCMGSPTYGTDRTANEQLVDDLTGILALGPRQREQVSYNPRGEIVVPSDRGALPPPQDNVVAAENSQWPESPEARRARLREEATANQDNIQYRSPIRQARSGQSGGAINPQSGLPGGHDRLPEGNISQQQRAQVNAALQERRQGSATTRRYLSDPPLTYRQPAETAPSGDVGEDEWRKDRERARATNQGRSWRDMLPW